MQTCQRHPNDTNYISKTTTRPSSPEFVEQLKAVKKNKNQRDLSKVIRDTAKVTMSIGKMWQELQDAKANDSSGPPPLQIPDLSAPELITEARQLIQQVQIPDALNYLQKASEKDADPTILCQTYTEAGNLAYDQGAYPLVLTAFESAFQINAHTPATSFNLGLAYHLNDDYEKANRFYCEALDMCQTEPGIWCNLGVVQFYQHDNEHAEYSTHKATELDPNFLQAWDNIATIFGAQGKLQPALEACMTALNLSHEYAPTWLKLGLMLFDIGEAKNAERALHHALSSPELSSTANFALARIKVQEGNIDEACDFYKHGNETALTPSHIGELAWQELESSLHKMSKYVDVKAYLQRLTI